MVPPSRAVGSSPGLATDPLVAEGLVDPLEAAFLAGAWAAEPLVGEVSVPPLPTTTHATTPRTSSTAGITMFGRLYQAWRSLGGGVQLGGGCDCAIDGLSVRLVGSAASKHPAWEPGSSIQRNPD
jgi:hypothetical protein